MRNCLVVFVASCFLSISCSGGLADRATVSEELRTIKTYPFGDPDPVPILAKAKNAAIYPYFRFDGFSHEGQDRRWKVVRLENKYIQVFVLPEAGGKIWGAVEKSTGKDFIYMNDVMKFRDIAMRGPWTSGGIEFNFGLIGHAPSTANPVDYATRENPDGSVSCFVGALDLPSRTEWRVEIRLPQDAAAFQTISLWSNPTPYQQSYYHWMNAAVHARDDLQFYYPGQYYIGHGGDVHPWPLNEKGIDQSLYRNHRFGSHKSLHVLGSVEEYSAGYWHDLGLGFGHWSRHEDMPGRKIWIWSLSPSGAIWEDLLTDKSGQYVEVQAGRQFSQAALSSGFETPFTQAAFAPYASDTWEETWFPVVKIGGVSAASPEGCLNVSVKDGKMNIGLHALRRVSGDLVAAADGREIYRETLTLNPMQVFQKEIPASGSKWDVAFGEGLRWSNPRPAPFARPVTPSPDRKTEGAAKSFLAGRQHELMREYDKALAEYAGCVKIDPLHVPAMTRMAEIHSRRGAFETAVSWAKRALQIDTYDADANFVFAIIQEKLGNFEDAEEALAWAARSPEYRSAAYTKMAEIHAAAKQWQSAAEDAKKALVFQSQNLPALRVLALAQRKLNRIMEAARSLAAILDMDPLNHFAHAETYFGTPTDPNRRQLLSRVRSELPAETFLELASRYAQWALHAEAAALLRLSPSSPIVDYWLAWLTREKPDESRTFLNRALAASPRQVFPFRAETIPVLEWAAGQNRSWKTRYYLGLLHWSQGNLTTASKLFSDCGDEPDYGPFYLTRSELVPSVADLKRALVLSPEEWRAWLAMTRFRAAHGDPELAAATAVEAYGKFPNNYAIGLETAKALLNTRQNRAALDILEKVNVLPYEGAYEGRALYERANLALAQDCISAKKYELALSYIAKSREWPLHLGVGKPYESDEHAQDELEALCRRNLKTP